MHHLLQHMSRRPRGVSRIVRGVAVRFRRVRGVEALYWRHAACLARKPAPQ